MGHQIVLSSASNRRSAKQATTRVVFDLGLACKYEEKSLIWSPRPNFRRSIDHVPCGSQIRELGKVSVMLLPYYHCVVYPVPLSPRTDLSCTNSANDSALARALIWPQRECSITLKLYDLAYSRATKDALCRLNKCLIWPSLKSLSSTQL